MPSVPSHAQGWSQVCRLHRPVSTLPPSAAVTRAALFSREVLAVEAQLELTPIAAEEPPPPAEPEESFDELWERLALNLEMGTVAELLRDALQTSNNGDVRS